MTQIWPGAGVAPVPILLSVICKPDCVVMVFPTACAVAEVGAPAAKMPANAIAKAKAVRGLARRNARILLLLGGHFDRIAMGDCHRRVAGTRPAKTTRGLRSSPQASSASAMR